MSIEKRIQAFNTKLSVSVNKNPDKISAEEEAEVIDWIRNMPKKDKETLAKHCFTFDKSEYDEFVKTETENDVDEYCGTPDENEFIQYKLDEMPYGDFLEKVDEAMDFIIDDMPKKIGNLFSEYADIICNTRDYKNALNELEIDSYVSYDNCEK